MAKKKRDSIKHEPYEGGLIRSYDCMGYKIRQVETGILYDVAIDVPNKYTYDETDIKIEKEEISTDGE